SSCRSRSRSCCSACRRSSMLSEGIMPRPAPEWIRTMNAALRIVLSAWGSQPMAKLLLIDDDPDLLAKRVAHLFPAPAHSVVIPRPAAKGLEHIAAELPDVILLDLRLPDQPGLDVLRGVRQIDARIPVVFVTVVRSADSAIEAVRCG